MAFDERHQPVLQAAHGGDPEALSRLLALCQPDIRRYARRNCLVSDIDDAVQEVLLVMSRRLPTLKVLAAFSGWLFKVVQRECRRLGRRAFRYDPYDEERAEQWLASHNDASLRTELVQALESLPRDYLQVILLRDFEELSISEIAQELGLTTAAAKSRLHRARALAREYLMA